MVDRTSILTCLLFAFCVLPTAAVENGPSSVDFSAIRGANYVPSYASTSVATWIDFEPEVINRELAYAKRLKLNSLRVFLQYVAYEEDPKQFLEHLEQFLTIAAAHEIRPMFVLFDSCFGKEPSVQEAHSQMWVNNPGYGRIAQESWSPLEAYVRDVVSAHARDQRVLMWDIMNEPMADFEHVQRHERDRIWKFCRHCCQLVKALDASHPITVGHAVVEYIPKTADLVDVLSLHSYSRYDDWLQQDVDLALRYGRQFGKPVIVTEFGNPGAGQRYEMALDVIERNKLGFYFWELMIAKVMFKEMSGLVYPDGSVRDLGPIARLLGQDSATAVSTESAGGFAEKTTGGVPQKQPPDGEHLRAFLAETAQWQQLLDQVTSTPRTRQTVTAATPTLALLGRHLYRPKVQAQTVFELSLNIPHHFRQGRDKQAFEEFETLLKLVSSAVEESRRVNGKQ